MFTVLIAVTIMSLAMEMIALAQDGTSPSNQSTVWAFALSLVDKLWQTTIGPMAMIAITKFFNTYVKAYIPRELQVPLAGLLGGIATLLLGGDPTIGAAGGAALQIALAVPPDHALASAKAPS